MLYLHTARVEIARMNKEDPSSEHPVPYNMQERLIASQCVSIRMLYVKTLPTEDEVQA